VSDDGLDVCPYFPAAIKPALAERKILRKGRAVRCISFFEETSDLADDVSAGELSQRQLLLHGFEYAALDHREAHANTVDAAEISAPGDRAVSHADREIAGLSDGRLKREAIFDRGFEFFKVKATHGTSRADNRFFGRDEFCSQVGGRGHVAIDEQDMSTLGLQREGSKHVRCRAMPIPSYCPMSVCIPARSNVATIAQRASLKAALTIPPVVGVAMNTLALMTYSSAWQP
jgi:hypothetical protein